MPMLFFKPPSALIGPGDAIVLPRVSQQVEFEAEIGVVIGKRLRDVDPERGRAGDRRLRLRQRRDLPRPPEDRRTVGPGQGVRHLLPGRAHGWRRASTGATSR